MRNSLNMIYFSDNTFLYTCHASAPSYSANRNQISCWRNTFQGVGLTPTAGMNKGLVSHIIDSRLAFSPSPPISISPESSLEAVENICSHATGITTFRIIPGAVLAIVPTTQEKLEKDSTVGGGAWWRQRLVS